MGKERRRHSEDAISLEQYLTYKLNILHNQLGQQMEAFLDEKYGITLFDWRILAILGRYGDLSMPEAASRAKIRQTILSKKIEGLINAGIVLVSPGAQKGDGSKLSLTDAGEQLYQKILPQTRARQRKLLDFLSADEQTVFHQCLDKLIWETSANTMLEW